MKRLFSRQMAVELKPILDELQTQVGGGLIGQRVTQPGMDGYQNPNDPEYQRLLTTLAINEYENTHY